MKRSPAFIGLCIALAFFFWKVGLFMLNLQYDVFKRFPIAPMMLLLFAGIVYVILRDVRTEKEFDVFKVFKKAAQLALVNAVISALLIFLYYKFIDPDFLENIKTQRTEEAAAQLQGEELDNALNTFEFMFNANTWAMFTLSGLTILGFAYSLIVAFLARFLLVKK